MDHGHSQRQTLAYAQRQLGRQGVSHVVQLESFQHFGDPCRPFLDRDVE